MRYLDLEQRVLQHVCRPEYQPVKPRVIAKQLAIDSDRKAALRVSLRRLVKQGLIHYGENHLIHAVPGVVAPAATTATTEGAGADVAAATTSETSSTSPASSAPADKKRSRRQERRKPDARTGESSHGDESNSAQSGKHRADRHVVTGTFRRTSHGFGFVRPANTPASSGRDLDIFIAAEHARDASNGDLVTVRVRKGGRGDKRLSGTIVEVLERDTHRFVGVYQESAGQAYVQIDGNVFTQPVAVGDPGAKRAVEGDKVVIEMVRFPSPSLPGEAVIVEVLGARGAPGVDTLSIIHEYGLPDEFPDDVMAAARQQAELFDETNLMKRTDFTADTVITIDPVDARDFDDAISLTRTDKGHWLLGVHIADVAHFVPEKTALDREARDRATSVYLPDRVIPMLPEIISNNLASLQPDKVRYTKTCVIEFTAEGVPVHAEVHHGAIKSKRRFTYEEVDEYLENPAPWREKLKPEVFTLLGHMHELAMIMRKRRLDGGAIELSLPEVKIDLDKSGQVAGAHVVVNTVSHQIIEEFMLAANEAVARLLRDKEVLFLRRVHESPDPRKLQALTDFVKELGIKCDSLESRFEIKRVIATVADQPEEYAVNYAVLRSMQKAVYGPEDEGHYALNSHNYCHFTSPIRRYPDLTVHRLFNDLLAGRRPPQSLDALMVLGEHCSEREQRAAEAERELIKVKLLGYLSTRIGEQMDAVITGVEQFGLFAMGTDLPAEGLIHVSSLQDDFYRFDRRSHSLIGNRANNSFRLGDKVRVEIARVDVDGRVLDLRLVKRLAGNVTRRRAAPADAKSRRKNSKSKRQDGDRHGQNKGGGKRRRKR